MARPKSDPMMHHPDLCRLKAANAFAKEAFGPEIEVDGALVEWMLDRQQAENRTIT